MIERISAITNNLEFFFLPCKDIKHFYVTLPSDHLVISFVYLPVGLRCYPVKMARLSRYLLQIKLRIKPKNVDVVFDLVQLSKKCSLENYYRNFHMVWSNHSPAKRFISCWNVQNREGERLLVMPSRNKLGKNVLVDEVVDCNFASLFTSWKSAPNVDVFARRERPFQTVNRSP